MAPWEVPGRAGEQVERQNFDELTRKLAGPLAMVVVAAVLCAGVPRQTLARAPLTDKAKPSLHHSNQIWGRQFRVTVSGTWTKNPSRVVVIAVLHKMLSGAYVQRSPRE